MEIKKKSDLVYIILDVIFWITLGITVTIKLFNTLF